MTQELKIKGRNTQATEVLRRLDAIGAIKLDVLVEKAAEIRAAVGSSAADDWEDHEICYKFYIRIGPPRDLDLVSVAAQLRELGFNLTRVAQEG
jgi:hypothetical protein